MANGLLSPVEKQTQSVFGMVPVEERLSLLPRYSKTQGLIAPQFIYELAKAVSTPIVAMRGDYVSPEEMLNVPLSGFAGSALGTVPKGVLRSGLGSNKNAEAMGFKNDVYHFSRDNSGEAIKEFKTSTKDLSPFSIGTHVGTKQAAFDRFLKTKQADSIQGATYPLKIKTERQFLNSEGNPYPEEQLSIVLRKLIAKIGDEKGIDAQNLPYKEQNKLLSDYIWKKYDAIPYINDVEDPGSISYIVPSQNIRSRFAQFDPKKIGSKDILAGIIPFGLLAEDDKDKKKDMRK